MQPIPALDGLSWSKIRALAEEMAATRSPEEVAVVAEHELGSADHRHRMLAVYLLGFTGGATRPANLALLRAGWRLIEVSCQPRNA